LALEKALSHSNTNEKSLDMLIKIYRKFHDKKGIGCDQNNTSTVDHQVLLFHFHILYCLLTIQRELSRITLKGILGKTSMKKDPK